MKNTFNDSRLQIVAAQLATIRAHEPRKSFIARVAARVRSDFLQKGWRDKARFVRFAAREGASRFIARLKRKRPSPIRVDIPADRLLVAARLNGGMGDLIIYSALLDRLYREWGSPEIHVVVHPLRMEEARFVFHDAPAIARLTDTADLDPETTPYDVVLTIGDLLSYDFIRQERVERIAPDALRALTSARQIQQPYRAFIDVQPLFDGLFTGAAAQSGLRRLDVLGWLGGVAFAQHHQLLASPDPDAYRRFDALALANRPYITIHNGWDNVAHRHTTNATKGWPIAHYEEFVARFKQQFPHVLVVQLGAKTSRPITGVDIELLDDTTLHEAAWILKHSLLHVDGDSGLVHLARALHTKSLALFGPTNHEFFAYDQNETCHSTVCGNCWWTTRDWMRSCPRGLAEPECMTSIEPADVLRRAAVHLRSLPQPMLTIEDVRAWPPRGLPATGDAAFHEWRASLIREAIAATGAAGSVAVVGNADVPSGEFAGRGDKVRRFIFDAEHESGGPTRDYGSIYNIPAENEAFDLVVMPLLSDQTRHPRAAIEEAQRILRENGLLVLAYRSVAGLDRILADLGIENGLDLPPAGGILLRKQTHGQLVAERTSRANQAVGV